MGLGANWAKSMGIGPGAAGGPCQTLQVAEWVEQP